EMKKRADKPGTANALRKVIRALMRHAIGMKLRTDDPTMLVKQLGAKNKKGYHSWTEPEIEQFETVHANNPRALLALTLLVWTCQRKSDVIRMGRQHIDENGYLYCKQQKTGTEVWIPLF